MNCNMSFTKILHRHSNKRDIRIVFELQTHVNMTFDSFLSECYIFSKHSILLEFEREIPQTLTKNRLARASCGPLFLWFLFKKRVNNCNVSSLEIVIQTVLMTGSPTADFCRDVYP